MAREQPLAEVLRSASLLIPDTEDYVRIKDADDGTISWYNKTDLPDVVSAGVPSFVTGTLLEVRLPPAAPLHVLTNMVNLFGNLVLVGPGWRVAV